MFKQECYDCGAFLGTDVRTTTVNGNKADKNGKTYVFCPRSNSPLVPDCINNFLKKLNPKRRKDD